jgi:hypothetical protein
MSHMSIKIKLNSAMRDDIPTSKIHGFIRQLSEESECAINYHEDHCENELNNLLFECIKAH